MEYNFPGKRRHETDGSTQAFKKRLVDSLSSLSIGTDGDKPMVRPVSPFMSSQEDLLPAYDSDGYMSTHSSDRVVIPSIDKFLRENPDDGDAETKPVLGEFDPEKLVIPNLRTMNEIFTNEKGFNNQAFLDERRRYSYERVAAQKRVELQKRGEDTFEVSVSDAEIYRDAYTLRYWSLVKWYDPHQVIMESLKDWYYRSVSPEAGDVSFYGDSMEDDPIEQTSPPGPNPNWISDYGSYYASTPLRKPIALDDSDMDLD